MHDQYYFTCKKFNINLFLRNENISSEVEHKRELTINSFIFIYRLTYEEQDVDRYNFFSFYKLKTFY